MGCKMMKPDKEWHEDDATWKLLGRAVPKQADGRFVDDVVRSVRLLPEADPFWPRVLRFSPLAAVAACMVVVAAWFLQNEPTGEMAGVKVLEQEAQWEQIEDVAEAELLAAAAEHLDQFSDQELLTMVGF